MGTQVAPMQSISANINTGTESGDLIQKQGWWEVTTPPSELASRCDALVSEQSKTGPLTLEQLDNLVKNITSQPEIWEPLVVADPSRRRYRLLFEDDRIDVWVLSWMPGQGTGFHDHDVSGVALICAQGCIVEKQMLLPSGATRIEMNAGYSRTGGAGYIHSVAWCEGSPAVSIHAYSPPLLKVGQYRVDENGILERRIENGRQELLDHTIGELDPERADG